MHILIASVYVSAANLYAYIANHHTPAPARYVKDAQATVAGAKKRELILVGNKVDLRAGTEEEPLLAGRQVRGLRVMAARSAKPHGASRMRRRKRGQCMPRCFRTCALACFWCVCHPLGVCGC